jgi:hypothetical protein
MVLVLKYSFFLINITLSVAASCALEIRGSRKIRELCSTEFFTPSVQMISIYSTTFQNVQCIYDLFS